MENTNLKYAGFWIRAIALLIDQVILTVIIVGLMFVLGAGSGLEALMAGGGSTVAVLLMYILPIIFVIGFWTKFQATPGKMILGLKIVDVNTGGKVGLGKLVIRYIGYILSAIPLMLGYFWAGWDSRKQGFHDKISSTTVVFSK